METKKEKQFTEDYFDYNYSEALYLTYDELNAEIKVLEAELALDFDKKYNKDLKNHIALYKKEIKKRLSLTPDNFENYKGKCFMVIYENEDEYDSDDEGKQTYIKAKSIVGHPLLWSKKVLWSFVCEELTYYHDYCSDFSETRCTMDNNKEVEFYNMIEVTDEEYNEFKKMVISEFIEDSEEDTDDED
jgi:hypothetical protein